MHAPEQVAGFLVGQRRVGLIEQEHTCVPCQRTRDLGPLPHGEGHVPERPIGVLGDGQIGHQCALGGVGSSPQEPRAFPAHHQVVGDGEVGEELRLLVNDGDAIAFDIRAKRLPIEPHFA